MQNSSNLHYPIPPRDNFIKESYHGVIVPDPFRPLEDPNSPATKTFIQAQNKLSKRFLEKSRHRDQIKQKVTEMWNYPKYSPPARRGSHFYFTLNTGLQQQAVLYQQDSVLSEPRIFFDPNQLSRDGTTAMVSESFSYDGSLFAYSLCEGGADWSTIRIKDVKTGEDMPETLQRIKFSNIAWTHNNLGFFYSCYSSAKTTVSTDINQLKGHTLFYHRVGQDQSLDDLVVNFPKNPLWKIYGSVSHCGNYLLVSVRKGTNETREYYADLHEKGGNMKGLYINPIINDFSDQYEYVTNKGSKFVYRTNRRASHYRLIRIDLLKVNEDFWEELIEEDHRSVLQSAYCADNDKLIVHRIHEGKSSLAIYSLDTGNFLRALPIQTGSIGAVECDKRYPDLFYYFSSYVVPGQIFSFNVSRLEDKNEQPTLVREINLQMAGFDTNDYVHTLSFYESSDKTRVPIHIIEKKIYHIHESDNGVERTPRPCVLHGYGGFGHSLTTEFKLFALLCIEVLDGVYAEAMIRGGGEYGQRWHDDGRLLNKQNCFDDFQAAAQYLTARNYTSHKKLGIIGASNGGLLVGACINQRPDLFRAAIAKVGVLDMLRFHKFTIGSAWMEEYGDPALKIHFENLYRFSPLHNVQTPKDRKDRYPATLVITSENDDRVSPLHSYKFVAALQEAAGKSEFQKHPILLRVYNDMGHGRDVATTIRIEQKTDILLFLFKALKQD